MIIKLSDFPYQPKQMECCVECKSIKRKDCESNPMACKDFCINNYEFINEKAGVQ